MNNIEALKAYNEGKKIRHENWMDDHYFSHLKCDLSSMNDPYRDLVFCKEGWSIVSEPTVVWINKYDTDGSFVHCSIHNALCLAKEASGKQELWQHKKLIACKRVEIVDGEFDE